MVMKSWLDAGTLLQANVCLMLVGLSSVQTTKNRSRRKWESTVTLRGMNFLVQMVRRGGAGWLRRVAASNLGATIKCCEFCAGCFGQIDRGLCVEALRVVSW